MPLYLSRNSSDNLNRVIYRASFGTFNFPHGASANKLKTLMGGAPFIIPPIKRSHGEITPDIVSINMSEDLDKRPPPESPQYVTALADGDDSVDADIGLFETTRHYLLPSNNSKVASANCALTDSVMYYNGLVDNDRILNCPASVESIIRSCKDIEILHDVNYRLVTEGHVVTCVAANSRMNSRTNSRNKPGRGGSREKVIKNIAETHEVSVSQVYALLRHVRELYAGLRHPDSPPILTKSRPLAVSSTVQTL